MQLHFYVPDELGEEIRRRAQAQGVPLSRYLVEIVQRELGGGWPPSYFDDVVGRWEGEPLERPAQGDVEQRDSL
jgi:hypothetical protein